ncbi:ABC-2 type transport system permease protein [Ruminiclostridium sufflavum DSM 19573]|uniref:ABC-2 type transport system permease protein n=1 Tax=Ruminiclostridium sufflavum DSM 19573 TaxID=1121337 RepID=A0A318XJ80_9FIRM|nr:DUF6449 domain-containing protein [Ruminiclostridium sufflavum]PYG87250.1 ABC-2 type transport system permease protein [Ruminiclostridium sufflavum DSM 19573]
MKLKTSLFKKGLLISDIKRFWWVSALYALALFFVMPFNHYMQYVSNTDINDINSLNWMKERIANEFYFNGGISQVFLIAVPVVIGALVFRYMQKSRSASLYHSLPLTRTALYFNSVLSAVILFSVPILFNTSIMLFMNLFSPLSAFYSAALIFTWLGCTFLFGIMFIAMSVFAGMFTGSSIAQLAFVYILNLLPAFLVEFVRINLRGVLYGFDTYSNIDFYRNMPMFRLFDMGLLSEGAAAVITAYTAVTLALFAGGLFAFKLRRPETAGDIITFRPVRPVFIYGFVTCATLFGGAYFIQIGNSDLAFAISGYFISSIISYIVIQMITNKSFKILHTYKGYVGFALVLVILTLGIHFDVIGYVNKIPDPKDVKETYIGYNLYWFEHKNDPDFDEKKYDNYDTALYKDPKNIENVTKLHKYLLDNKSRNGNQQYIAYKLKNGKKIIRKYSIDTATHASVLSPIYESGEYKENRYPILHQEANDLKYIEISDRRIGKSPFIVSDKAQLNSFKDAIRKDIADLNYQDMVSSSQDFITITIIDTNDKQIIYALRSDYTNTFDWLKKEGIYEQVIARAEDINSITLHSIKYSYGYQNYGKSFSGSSMSDIIEITDKAVIQEILNLSLNADSIDTDTQYIISIEGSSGTHYNEYSLKIEGKVSPELQSYLDKIQQQIQPQNDEEIE